LKSYKKLIKVYGERNTNTNYISKLIRLNLNVLELPGVAPSRILQLKEMLSGNELVVDLYFHLTFKNNLGWKHMCVKPVTKLTKCKIYDSNVSFLTITKNPYSWLLSLYRNPYHQYGKKIVGFEKFLITPWKTLGRENCSKILKSPIDLWNKKNASYLQLDGINSLNIKTEYIYQDPIDIINKISDRFHIHKISNEFENYTLSTKDENKDFTYYRRYYLEEMWRDSISKDAISIIGESVDKNLMNHFGYDVLS